MWVHVIGPHHMMQHDAWHVGFSVGMASPMVLSSWCRRLWVQCDNCQPIAYTTPVTTVSWLLCPDSILGLYSDVIQ